MKKEVGGRKHSGRYHYTHGHYLGNQELNPWVIFLYYQDGVGVSFPQSFTLISNVLTNLVMCLFLSTVSSPADNAGMGTEPSFWPFHMATLY